MGHDERDNDGAAEARGPVDIEAAFADIVARWDESSAPVGSWPAQEDIGPVIIGDDQSDQSAVGDDQSDQSAATPAGPALSGYDVPLAPEGWKPAPPEPVEEPEGFVPPDPPPLPRGDPIGWLAWAAVLGGPLFLLLASQVWTDVGRIWIMLAVLAFIAGFATIVARLPNSRNDDDPDDGAVV